ncbi:MAG TPA: hypothetical protein DDZ39_10320 [Flavobacteriaceae bacterium]|jgi:hypothetical protein|nr:hypothetical protein [Flavobacteriaceae bacterium]HBS11095.1 hypothetical protein [Flavobacteriaceae bacterium]
MPANPKYLIKSPWEITIKLVAAIVPTYYTSLFFHLSLAVFTDATIVLNTMYYSHYFLWLTLSITVYLFRSAWKSLLFYIFLAFVFYGIMHFGKIYYPIAV